MKPYTLLAALFVTLVACLFLILEEPTKPQAVTPFLAKTNEGCVYECQFKNNPYKYCKFVCEGGSYEK